MKIIEIQRAEWVGFFNSFTKQHQDWLVTVAVNDQEQNKILGNSLILKGISVDKKRDIILNLSNSKDENIDHYIYSPELVTLELTEEGADDELFIKGSDSFTGIRFLNVAAPVKQSRE